MLQSRCAMESTPGSIGAPTAQKEHPTHLAARHLLIDWTARLLLFSGLVIGLAWPAEAAPEGRALYAGMLIAIAGAAYLLASVEPVALWIHQRVKEYPLPVALLPVAWLALLYPYILSAEQDPAEVLFFGVFLFLATAAAILNVPPLQRADISLGLILVAVPLVMPVIPDTPFSAQAHAAPLTARAIAFLLPLALLLLTNTQQKQRLNLLFICAALALWYSAHFGALPTLPIGREANAFAQLTIPVAGLYMLAIAGRFDRLGLSFRLTPRQVSITASNAVLLAALYVPLGLVTSALVPSFSGPDLLEVLWRWLSIFLLQALPTEILLRGTLITYLQDDLQLSPLVAIAVSVVASVVVGWTSLSWLLALSAIAAVFYARIFLATRNVVASSVVHATLLWVLWLLFGG